MLADASPEPYWLDRSERPAARPRLVEDIETDLVVIGGGFTGLWAAVQAAEEQPGRDIVLVEGERIAEGASGRNGGFCAASLTHGLANGHERFTAELPTLLRMGGDTLDAIEAAVARHGIDCDFERSGELDVATAPWQADALTEEHALAQRLGLGWRLLDRDQVQAEVASPTYLAGDRRPRRRGYGRPRPAGLGPGRDGRAARRTRLRALPGRRSGPATARASRWPPRMAGSARPGPWWPLRPGGRCGARSGRTWCRSGTTP